MSTLMNIFVFMIYIQLAFSQSSEEVLRELKGEHGPRWESLISSSKNLENIKSNLIKIIENPESFQDKNDDKDVIDLIKKNAMIQLGHFVTNEEGFIGDEQKKWYQKQLKQDEGIDSYAIHQSLANSGSHEGLEILLDETKGAHPSQVFKLIKKSLYGSENREKAPLGIFPEYPKIGGGPKVYAPNISVPYYQRSGNGWPKTIWNVRKKMSDVLRMSSQDQNPNNYLVQLSAQINQKINEDFNFFTEETQQKFYDRELIDSSWDEIKKSSNKPEAHSHSENIIQQKGKKPASIEDAYENQESNISFLSLSLLFTVLMLGFFVRKFL